MAGQLIFSSSTYTWLHIKYTLHIYQHMHTRIHMHTHIILKLKSFKFCMLNCLSLTLWWVCLSCNSLYWLLKLFWRPYWQIIIFILIFVNFFPQKCFRTKSWSHAHLNIFHKHSVKCNPYFGTIQYNNISFNLMNFL